MPFSATILSTESAPFYRMARFLGIPRKRRFLKSAEHIHDVTRSALRARVLGSGPLGHETRVGPGSET